MRPAERKHPSKQQWPHFTSIRLITTKTQEAILIQCHYVAQTGQHSAQAERGKALKTPDSGAWTPDRGAWSMPLEVVEALE